MVVDTYGEFGARGGVWGSVDTDRDTVSGCVAVGDGGIWWRGLGCESGAESIEGFDDGFGRFA